MKVGVLGSGDVAKALAGGFIKHGHQTMIGTRDSGKVGGVAPWKPQSKRGQLQRDGCVCRGGGAGGERFGCGRCFARGGKQESGWEVGD